MYVCVLFLNGALLSLRICHSSLLLIFPSFFSLFLSLSLSLSLSPLPPSLLLSSPLPPSLPLFSLSFPPSPLSTTDHNRQTGCSGSVSEEEETPFWAGGRRGGVEFVGVPALEREKQYNWQEEEKGKLMCGGQLSKNTILFSCTYNWTPDWLTMTESHIKIHDYTCTEHSRTHWCACVNTWTKCMK